MMKPQGKKQALAMKIGLALMAGLWATSSMAFAAADLPVAADGGVSANVLIQEADTRMDIASTAAHNVLKWQDFSIGEKHTVAFDGKDYLNLVTGGVQSEILGTLTGGGNIYLINPSGILFGTNAQVNAGAFYASTRALPTEGVLNDFTQNGTNPLAANVDEVGGDIINRGTIAADTIVLEAGRISIRNYADIQNKAGEVLNDEHVQLRAKEKNGIHVGHQVGDVVTEVNDSQWYWGSNDDQNPAPAYKATTLDGTTENAPVVYALIHNIYELQNIKNSNWNLMPLMLADDINAEGVNFTPLDKFGGGSTYRFDGLGYTIRNLSIEGNGIFTTFHGTIENVNIADSNIASTAKQKVNVGALVGTTSNYNDDLTIIRNVHVSNTNVSTDGSAGGVVGQAGSLGGSLLMENVSVTGGTVTSGRSAGGIIGGLNSNLVTLKNVSNTSTVKLQGADADAEISLGGLVGGIYNGAVSVENSYNASSLIADGLSNSVTVGGLVANSPGNNTGVRKIAASYNTGDINVSVTGDGRYVYAGGFVGHMGSNRTGESDVVIEKSYNAGNISISAPGDATVYSGGLIGYLQQTYDNITIANAYNTGDAAYGLIGYVACDDNKLSVNNAYYTKGSGAYVLKEIPYSDPKQYVKISETGVVDARGYVTTTDEDARMFYQPTAEDYLFAAYDISTSYNYKPNAVWRVYTGHTLPLLTNFMKQGTITTTKTYNGENQSFTLSDIASENPSVYYDTTAGIAQPDLPTMKDAGTETRTAANLDMWVWSDQQGVDIAGYDFVVKPQNLTASFTKTYNGQTTIDPAQVTFAGLVGSDTVTVSGTADNWTRSGSTFTTAKNAGYGYAVDVAGLTLSSGNYRLTSATGEITKKALTPGFAAISKTYDGTTDATAGAVTLDGVVAGEEVTATAASAAYEDKNAGSKNVIYSGLSLSGADAGNYSLAESATGSGTIKKATATLTANAVEITEGDEIPALTGKTTGLATGDSDNATWSTEATAESKAGSYAINGTFTNNNYEVTQAESNATALTIKAADTPTDNPGTTTDPVNPSTDDPGTTTDPVNPSTDDPGTTTDPVNPSTDDPGTTTDPLNPSTEEPISSDREPVINPSNVQEVAEAFVQQDSRSTVVQAQNAATAATQESANNSGSDMVSPEAAATGASVEVEQTSPVSVESDNNGDNGSDNSQQEKEQQE